MIVGCFLLFAPYFGQKGWLFISDLHLQKFWESLALPELGL